MELAIAIITGVALVAAIRYRARARRRAAIKARLLQWDGGDMRARGVLRRAA